MPFPILQPPIPPQLIPLADESAKTRLMRKTRDPIYSENFTFYDVSISQLRLAELSLGFEVMSFDKFSRNERIGSAVFPLDESFVCAGGETKSVKLQREAEQVSAGGGM